MKWLFFSLILVALVIGVLALPLLVLDVTRTLDEANELFTLFRLYLVTCAFIGALWAVYLKDSRLRANSDNVLVALIVFVSATILLALAILLALIANTAIWMPRARYVAFISVEVYLAGLVLLLWTVLAKTYNQLYNLRTNKFLKYFKPVRWLRVTFGPHKHYELSMEDRTPLTDSFHLHKYLANEVDSKRIKNGAAILVTGRITECAQSLILECVIERLAAGETANYVAADRHPVDAWNTLESKGADKYRNDVVLIDAYSPGFAFTDDDIYRENDRRLRDKGVSLVKARTFAELHTAINHAFNIIKDKERKEQRNVRRPTVMVYAHTSALCDLESNEQFRVFWRHVIPSERHYGMLSFIIEDESAGPSILDILEHLVDFVFRVSEETPGDLKITRTK